MKYAGKKMLRRAMRREANRRTETRDAVIASIDTENRVLTVLVHGSPYPIKARFANDWDDPQSRPHWVQRGMSVQIRHRGGIRKRVDVVGPGLLVPGTTVVTDPPTGADAVIEGCSIRQVAGVEVMAVWVTTGYYRIDNVVYELEAVPVGYEIPSGWEIPIALCAGIVYLAAPPVGNEYRFDIIVVGADGVLDLVQGVPDSTSPEIPDTPADHVLLGSILMYPGMVWARAQDITPDWEEPHPAIIKVTPETVEMPYEMSSQDITVQICDQRGVPMGGPAPTGWYITLEFAGTGSGYLYSPDEGISYESIGCSTGAAASSCTFTYYREKDAPASTLPEMDHYTYFSEYSEGTQPDDWSLRYQGTTYGTFHAVSPGQGYGSKVLFHDSKGNTGRQMLSWDPLDNTKDLSILTKVRVTETAGHKCYIFARAHGTYPVTNAYYVRFSDTDFILGGWREVSFLDPSGGWWIASTPFVPTVGTDYWIRFRVIATELKVKLWEDGTAEPETWTLEGTDDAYQHAGWTGVGGYDSDWYCDAFGVNTALAKIYGSEESPVLLATLRYEYEIRTQLYITLIGADGEVVHPYEVFES
jgi:hypothetical protein